MSDITYSRIEFRAFWVGLPTLTYYIRRTRIFLFRWQNRNIQAFWKIYKLKFAIGSDVNGSITETASIVQCMSLTVRFNFSEALHLVSLLRVETFHSVIIFLLK